MTEDKLKLQLEESNQEDEGYGRDIRENAGTLMVHA